MRPTALYYPFVIPRNRTWWKVAALYWSSVARLLPSGVRFPVYSELDLAPWNQIIDPAPYTDETSEWFREQLEYQPAQYGPAFTSEEALSWTPREAKSRNPLPRIGDMEALRRELTDPGWGGGAAFMARDELAPSLQSYLVEQGLALEHPTKPHFLIVRNALARAYKCALSEEVARRNKLVPITDTLGAHLAMGTGVGDPAPLTSSRFIKSVDRDTYQLVGTLALKIAVPGDIERLSEQSIVALREEYATNFNAFAQQIHDTAVELGQQLVDVADPQVAQNYIKQEVAGKFEAPYRQLERDIKSLGMEAVSSIASVKVELPALTAAGATHLIGHNLLLSTAVGAGFGFMAIRNNLKQKASALTPPGPASFLLNLRRLQEQDRWGKTKQAVRRALYGGPL